MKLSLIIMLIITATSCASTHVSNNRNRLTFSAHDLKIHVMPTIARDKKYESIEFDEIKRLAISFKQHLKRKGIQYKEDVFDCDDYSRGFVAWVMINHDYKLTPAVGTVHIDGHMLNCFYDDQGKIWYYDVQNYKLTESQNVIGILF